ncbi:MAG: NAD(P)H-binding protein [Bryobacteraceae bacterium]
MRVVLFGATGMVGQGVLRECLLDPGVDFVVSIGRSPLATVDPKLAHIVHAPLTDFDALEPRLAGFDACFFCLGVASAGMSEAEYSRVTYDVTLAAAQTLARLNPAMTFVFVSGAGADSSEKGRLMWARVKGRAENAILRLPFQAAYAFRPGMIQPLHGIESRTPAYRRLYKIVGPLFPLLRRLLPNQILTTEQIGRAMLGVVRDGYPRRVLERHDILAAAGG